MTNKVTFVTGNKGKLREVKAIFEESISFEFIQNDIDLDEIQGSPEEVIIDKIKRAAKEVNGPVICEDVSLCFNGLNGMPGPYIKWFLKKLGVNGLVKILSPFEDKTCYALCIFAFCKGPNSEPILFKGRTNGTIVEPRGENGFGWDPIFLPENCEKTFGEMELKKKNTISHRKRALMEFKKFTKENPNFLN
ncbi:inosine triphosphate pyrophosphatase/ham1 protein [Anaeramoeba flamelloides]|uniref:Inosine triphosphate pyrophosphatase n=1 Tax=Anaeramoeba flamelloides TaxID=1746091 RepID=A0AAV8A430_9EUKA|nr:inosine triphosphate pyrophosphatase/ham1 protein [Anaeramoeba flamelloides]KAJ6237542.1 inosine triphosphate pyrophosphatase/ham1 protein [Anaeramoeba flamelloides]KAJ6241231.1 inosine triphosphate pyrophosphatase/ham1 protein [Anaeramoeba flamelloides]